MTIPELIMWTVVLGIGIPAALRNWTALALCGAWLFGEIVWRLMGDNLPINLYFFTDFAVLLVIFIKPEVRDLSPYHSFADQMKALWLERSLSDGIIASIFPLMWIVYVADIGDFYRWWVLWGLAQTQFFTLGGDAYRAWKALGEKIFRAKIPGLFKLGLAGHG